MRIAILWAACVASVFGQEPAGLFEKAPPAVDQALRERVAKFYQLHVDGKFRQAEALVAEDTKDFFYALNKPKYLSYEIKNIAYSDNFRKAKVIILVQMIVMAPGFLDKPVPVPIPSRWKIDNGEWCWYIDPDEINQTPFGKMKRGTAPATSMLPSKMPTPEEAAKMLAGVKAENDQAELKAREASTAEYTIINGMPGKITLSLEPVAFPGISAKLEPKELGAGEKAHVTVEWTPNQPAPRTLDFRVHVQPTNQFIALHARFTN